MAQPLLYFLLFLFYILTNGHNLGVHELALQLQLFGEQIEGLLSAFEDGEVAVGVGVEDFYEFVAEVELLALEGLLVLEGEVVQQK